MELTEIVAELENYQKITLENSLAKHQKERLKIENPQINKYVRSIDLFFIRQKDVDYYLKLGKEATLEELRKDKHYSLIEDTISEMEWWHCFQKEEPKVKRIKPSRIGQLELVSEKRTNSQKKAKNRAKNKRQKQARRKNRSKKK